MYNPNIPNINEVGHYKKINVTELRQMPEDELIRFFVNVSGGEFEERMGIMTEDEQEEVNDFIDNIPKDIFDKIIEQINTQIIDSCNASIDKCKTERTKISNAINSANEIIDDDISIYLND